MNRAERAPRLARVAGGLLLGALLLAQAANFTASDAETIALRRRLGRPGAAGVSVNALELSLVVYRALGELAPRIPEDGRVLIVVDSDTPMTYDFQLLPRPVRVLFTVTGEYEQRVARLDPVLGGRLQWWHAQIDERDQRLTPESLRRQLAQSDWLLTVQTTAAPLVLPDDGPHRVALQASGPVVLYRLEHGP